MMFDSSAGVALVHFRTDSFLENRFLPYFHELTLLGCADTLEECYELVSEQHRVEVVLFDCMGAEERIPDVLVFIGKLHKAFPMKKNVIVFDGKDMSWIKEARKAKVDGIWHPQASTIGIEKVIAWVLKDEIVYAGQDAFYQD